MTVDGEAERYRAIWRRFDFVVQRLTEMGKIEEADHLMIEFFIFFEQPEKLEEIAGIAEKMLANDEW